MKPILLFCLLFNLVMTCPIIGQVIKQPLTAADYDKWSTMEVEQISDYGNWVSYSLRYENETDTDTLFVKNTKNHKTYFVAGASNGTFAMEKVFVCQDANGSLVVTDLVNGKQTREPGVLSYTIVKDKSMLVLHRTGTNDVKALIIQSLEGKKDVLIANVASYSYNENANKLVYASDKTLKIWQLGTSLAQSTVIDSTADNYSDFVWQSNGESLAYFAQNSARKVNYFRIKEKQLYTFDSEHYTAFPKDVAIYNASFSPLKIADDGKMVFFGLLPATAESRPDEVQVWNTADKMLYPKHAKLKNWQATPKIAYWIPDKNDFRILTDNEFPKAMLTENQNKALVYNPVGNEPQPNRDAPIDFYLKDLETGKLKLVVEKQSAEVNKLSVAPNGNLLAYYKNKQWWIYNSLTDLRWNITERIGVGFENENDDDSGERGASGIAGWTANNDALLIYDTYDVWLVKTDGSGFKRITDGREKQLVYRIVPQTLQNQSTTNFTWIQKGIYVLKDGLLLSAVSDKKSGYFEWDMKKGLTEIIFSDKRIRNIRKSKTGKVYVFTEEHYHQSPILKVKFPKDVPAVLFRSNPQQEKFNWGFSKLFSYATTNQGAAKGALFYPAQYNPEKIYPMVVYIYERLSSFYNQYENPSMYNDIGFNISNLTSSGYFVLTPDILYEEGNTGKSAVDCVLSACNEVLLHEPIDTKKIGIIGHSFGGYETNFIITQTNFFAAAISGAGIFDLTSEYLYMGWNLSQTNYWRFESDQFRLGTSLFQSRDVYARNSPVNFVEKIETPVMLWSGENDRQVNCYQSLEFYLALRRLQKPNVLLMYGGESHVLSQKRNQEDLTRRTEEWFDFYLKVGNKPDWLLPDKL